MKMNINNDIMKLNDCQLGRRPSLSNGRQLLKLIALACLIPIVIGCSLNPALSNIPKGYKIPYRQLEDDKWCLVRGSVLPACREFGIIDKAKFKMVKIPSYPPDRISIRIDSLLQSIYIIAARTGSELLMPAERISVDTLTFAIQMDSIRGMYYYSFIGGDASYGFGGKEYPHIYPSSYYDKDLQEHNLLK